MEELAVNESDTESSDHADALEPKLAVQQQIQSAKVELLQLLQKKGRQNKVKRLFSLKSREERMELKIKVFKKKVKNLCKINCSMRAKHTTFITVYLLCRTRLNKS